MQLGRGKGRGASYIENVRKKIRRKHLACIYKRERNGGPMGAQPPMWEGHLSRLFEGRRAGGPTESVREVTDLESVRQGGKL